MDLSASAVERKTFDKIRRDGFNPEQVSSFLVDVAEELAHLRGELAQERSRSEDLEQSLEDAKSASQREDDSFLELSATKERVMETAERKALALLASAHAAAGHENPEGMARDDLSRVLDEAEAGESVLSGDEPAVFGPVGAMLPAGGIFGPGMGDPAEDTQRALAGAHLLLAEASQVPSIQQTDIAAEIAAARDEAERVHLRAKLIHARAEVRVNSMIADAEREAARLETLAAENAASIHQKAIAEAALVMDEARGLPERFAAEAEALVIEAHEQADNILKTAWADAEQAQAAADAALEEALLEAQEVRRQTAEAIDDAEAHIAGIVNQAESEAAELRAIAGTERDTAGAEGEAASIIAAAEERREELASEIADLEAERERVAGLTAEEAETEAAEARARAFEEIEVAEAEISELLATARADASAMRAAASEEGAGILEEARAEARRVIEGAAAEAESAVDAARTEHQEMVARLRSMKLIIEELQQRLPDLAMNGGDDADIVVLLDEAGAAAIDLRHRLDGIDDDWEGDTPMRASRYSKRSAGLPSIGREESEKAIGGMANLRAVDIPRPSRKRGGRNKDRQVDVADSDEESA